MELRQRVDWHDAGVLLVLPSVHSRLYEFVPRMNALAGLPAHSTSLITRGKVTRPPFFRRVSWAGLHPPI
jgi:hypothetical protein